MWSLLRRIPYGETRSYGQLAVQLGDAALARSVGAANARNPLGVIVPCHRVVGASGTLTGYAGGLKLKQWLLDHEAATARRSKGGLTPVSLAAVAPRAVQLAL